MPVPHETLVALAPGRQLADEWALVLAAEGLRPRIVQGEAGWGVFVADPEALRAEAALAAYREESRRAHGPARRPTWRGEAPLVVGLALAAAMLLFYRVTGAVASGSVWLERGAATERIVAGEPWRAATALTLHADPEHVLANAVAGALFFSLWLRVLGPGVGLALLLLSGVLGNALNAALQAPGHVSIGASTAVFGAVGLLAGVAALRREGAVPGRRRAWVVVAAGLALLGMLGTGGQRTDLWAHAFGLLAGAVLGAGAAALLRGPPRPAVQWAAGLLAGATLLAAWAAALD